MKSRWPKDQLAPNRICETCGTPFHVHQNQINKGWARYCSKRCVASAMEESTNVICEYCGKLCKKRKSMIEKYEHHYCSIECHHKDVIGSNSPLWRGGLISNRYCYKFNAALKEEIRAKFGYKCFFCGTYEGLQKHHVHHVDYNKVQGCKGQKWALIPLCCKEHVRTNTHRYYWFCLLRDYWIYEYEGFDLWVPEPSYFKKNSKKNRKL